MSRAPWLTRADVARVRLALSTGMTHREAAAATGLSLGSVANVAQGRVAGKRPPAAAPAAPTHQP